MSRWAAYAVAGALEVTERIGYAAEIGERSAFGLRALHYGVGRSANAGKVARRRVAAETHIGADLYHSDADRKRAVAQLADGFAKFGVDLAAQIAQAPGGAPWIQIDAQPTLDEWAKFYANEIASWTARFVTDWSEYEEWHERLKRLRELARAHGLLLASAEPAPLPETIWEQGSQGHGGKVSVLVSLLKVAIYAAIALTGFVALFSAWRDIRAHGRMALAR